MRGYMARLGNFTFSINTAAFQDLQRTSTYRWQAVNRIGRKPAQQNTGSGADTIRLRGTIYPHFRGGLGQIEQMRQQAGRGIKLPLVYANTQAGQFIGNFCITEIEETRQVFNHDGTPRKIEFTLTLVEYGDDAGFEGGLRTAQMVKNIAGITAAKQLFPTITGNTVLDKAFANAGDLARNLPTAAGKLVLNLGNQLDVLSSFSSELGDLFGPVKNAVIEGVDAATGIKGSGATALILLGETPQAQRIINACDAMTNEVTRGVQIATRSSTALVTAYGGIDTATAPADLVSSMRSASRSAGQLAKLCTDTSMAALRIKETVET